MHFANFFGIRIHFSNRQISKQYIYTLRFINFNKLHISMNRILSSIYLNYLNSLKNSFYCVVYISSTYFMLTQFIHVTKKGKGILVIKFNKLILWIKYISQGNGWRTATFETQDEYNFIIQGQKTFYNSYPYWINGSTNTFPEVNLNYTDYFPNNTGISINIHLRERS